MNTEQIRNNCPNCSKWAEEGCHPKCIQCQNIIKIFESKTNNQQRLLEIGYTKNSFTKKPKKSV